MLGSGVDYGEVTTYSNKSGWLKLNSNPMVIYILLQTNKIMHTKKSKAVFIRVN